MKLSKAILNGCKMVPYQAQGFYFYRDGSHACVLGAAYAGIKGDHKRILNTNDNDTNDKKITSILLENFKCLRNLQDQHSTNDLFGKITTLNDYKGWSRERIAKWLAKKGL